MLRMKMSPAASAILLSLCTLALTEFWEVGNFVPKMFLVAITKLTGHVYPGKWNKSVKHVWTWSEQEEELDTPRSNMTRSHFLGVVSTRVQALVTSYMRASVAQSDGEQPVHRLYFLKEVHFLKHFKEVSNRGMFEMYKTCMGAGAAGWTLGLEKLESLCFNGRLLGVCCSKATVSQSLRFCF